MSSIPSVAGDLVSFAVEYMMALWFFRVLENRPEVWRKRLGYLALAGLLYLYLTPHAGKAFELHSIGNLGIQISRMLYHEIIILGFLCLAKSLPAGCAAYQAGVFTLLYMAVQNIRISSALLIGMTGGTAPIQIATWVVLPVEVLLFDSFRRKVRLPAKYAPGLARWVLISIAVGLELYFKWSLSAMQNLPGSQQGMDSVFFAFFASLGVLITIGAFEINQQEQEARQKEELERVTLSYEMQNARRALQTNTDIRRLYHDMKNHLLAIQTLADDQGEVNKYLEDLLPQFEGYESQVSTGNATVDALLSEKIQLAALAGVHFNIYLDLTTLSQVRSVDLVVIFGNAVDNAIEAVQELPDEQERMIFIKSSGMANMTALRFSNRFVGKRELQGEKPETTKQDRELHGIGLTSIEQTVKRYGGSMSIQVEKEEHWFHLTVILPHQS